MEKRNDFLTFLSALIPGVGYMYLGLFTKGIEALGVFILVEPLFHMLGLGFLSNIVKVPLWLYTFFDTFNIAKRKNAGEYIIDESIILKKLNKKYNFSGNNSFDNSEELDASTNKGSIIIIGWILIICGVLAVINRVFDTSNIYYLVKYYLTKFTVPIILVVVGVYLLIKDKATKEKY